MAVVTGEGDDDAAPVVEPNDRLGSKTGGVCNSPRGPRLERRRADDDGNSSVLVLLLVGVSVVTTVVVRPGVRAVVCDDPAGEATPCRGVVCAADAAARAVYSSSSSWSSALSASPSRARIGVAGMGDEASTAVPMG